MGDPRGAEGGRGSERTLWLAVGCQMTPQHGPRRVTVLTQPDHSPDVRSLAYGGLLNDLRDTNSGEPYLLYCGSEGVIFWAKPKSQILMSSRAGCTIRILGGCQKVLGSLWGLGHLGFPGLRESFGVPEANVGHGEHQSDCQSRAHG